MALPINIESLINGDTIEWERIEFKQNWNPEDILHSMCAFANDLHNWGGGYIVVGITENNGQPVLPPSGLAQNQLDNIQGEIVQLAHKIMPNYFPITQPYVLQGQHILVLWCPAGDNRPYTGLTTLGKGGQRQPYVRIGSRSMIARGETLRQLQDLTARIPFDDRVNNQATINDFDLGTIQAYLQEIKSDLYAESTSLTLEELAKTMLIVKGPEEDVRPVNVGLLFFTKEPHKFFPRTQIELVWHQDNSGKNFKEQIFKGPLHHQLRDALSFLETNIITEQVVKDPQKAEAQRFYNFPFAAVEEALSNAVYHKSYEIGSPIEIQVWQDKIEILSFPGPVPPVTATILKTQKRIVAREYRNRRIGDFLKELHLTEGRGTGLPTIYRAMENNGSAKPIIDTDEQSTYVLVTLPAHPLFKVSDQASDGATDQDNTSVFNTLEDVVAFVNQASDGASDGVNDGASNQVKEILNNEVHNYTTQLLSNLTNWISREDLFSKIDLSNNSTNRKKYLDPLFDLAWVKEEFPNRKTHPKQRYKLTDLGVKIIKLIS
ncbi:RNA-binding domain-containing protein [Algibacter pacificus]|uniref:RNA-binding domain-containing protein n=1 Tax=Algibacter pacificus TaxID=2599389 RepID=UPI0011C7EA2F|nr:RNA-binding domain-containing protein [Algibacter pacificus]